jgi:hypothetical protein
MGEEKAVSKSQLPGSDAELLKLEAGAGQRFKEWWRSSSQKKGSERHPTVTKGGEAVQGGGARRTSSASVSGKRRRSGRRGLEGAISGWSAGFRAAVQDLFIVCEAHAMRCQASNCSIKRV